MFKIGDYIVYKKDVCLLKDIQMKKFNNRDYYLLEPIGDPSLKLDVLVDSPLIRSVISKEEVDSIINEIPNIDVIESDDKNIEFLYKKLLDSNDHYDLIKIIKTTYLRNKNRLDSNKKISEKDNTYFELAEKYLYNEFSIALNKSFSETKEYVISKVLEMQND